ncbi:MAG: outer membrane protein assembly factor BamA [Rhizobiaceae bacterium]
MKSKTVLLSAVSAVAISARVLMGAAVVMAVIPATAAHAASFRSIDVRGNVRVDASTIRDYIGIKPGQSYSASDLDEAIKRLYSTGLFSDVSITQSGGTLVITVSENQVINQVLFAGNKKIKDASLSTQVQLKSGNSLDSNTLEQDAETIREAYRRIGRADVVVTPTTTDLGEGRVNVVFEIQEGDRTKIATINFVGNNAYSDRRLGEVISTKKSNLLSFISRNDVYDEDRIKADEEALRRFYFNKGYADFQVVSSTAELDDASNKYTVTISVEEGERYKFGDISVESTVEGITSEDLAGAVETRQGDNYSAKDVEDSIIGISERVANKGYAFAQVTPRGDRDFANRTINIIYTVDQGAKTYVDRIEIRGNDKTRDYVIRREFDLAEGDAFNQVMIQKGKRRLEKLDFFERVEVSTVPGDQPDQVVLVIDVTEKSTGEFSVGAGYSTGGAEQGVNLEVGVTERNFLGRGQYIKVSAGGSTDTRTYNLSFTEPYFLGYRVAAGFDIFKTETTYDAYSVDRTGATVRFGLPFTDQLSGQVAYNIVQDDYNATDKDGNGLIIAPEGLPAYIPDGTWIKSSLSYNLTFSNIDNVKDPRAGLYARFSQEVAGLGGDAKWLKTTAKASFYQTLSEELNIVGLLSAGGGHIYALNGTDLAANANGIRVGDLFKANNDIVRGFDYNGFGPKLGTDFVGGSTYLNASAEVQFPMPAIPESIGIKGAVFADIGTLYGSPFTDANLSGADMAWRSSVGASLIWASPFGPLRVDYSFPVMKEDGDKIKNLNFGIATKF